ncbi:MAG TPA: amidohydrolase family protein [Bryobacteraceae bacterium]|nr:amidohydrolase family protein [Bryobacteraceae bacterium]
MRILVVLVMTAVLLPALSYAQPATAYHGFTRLDPMTKAVAKNAYVVIKGQHIAQVGHGPVPRRKGWKYVDMSGRFGLPGFFDAHAHLTAGPLTVSIENGAPRLAMTSVDSVTQFQALVALAFGVTTIRNPAGDPDANANYDRKLRTGEWIGPDALHAGFTFDPTAIAGLSIYPKDRTHWDREIARQKQLGMRYVKVYTGLSESELALAIEIAHARGLKVIGHLDRISWTRAIELGIDALTHALPTSKHLLKEPSRAEYIASRSNPDSKFMYRWFELADYESPAIQELIRMLAARRIAVDLTLLVNEIIYFFNDVDSVFPIADRKFNHPLVMKTLFQNLSASHTGWTEDDYSRARSVMPKVLELARRFHKAGVPLLLGTDAAGGAPFYARELSLHVRAGIPVWEVLQLATTLAAQRLGVANRTGAMEAGKEADIVFLKRNPLDDIANTRDVDTVVSNGRAYRFDELINLAAKLGPE